MKKPLLYIFLSLILGSCATKEEILYFQNAEKLENMKSVMEFEPVFEVNDVISIQVSSIDPDIVEPFQMMRIPSQGSSIGQQGSSMGGYLVDIDGNIQFPVLGKVKVSGKSRSDLEAILTEKIHAYVTDAVVAVRLLNFRVVVLGETGETVVNVENERISMPELIATVGGITYDGKRDNIMVIREIDGVKTVGRLDMTSVDIFKNPFYYLKQNDIVYVEPTYKKVKEQGFITSYTGLISLGTTIFGLIVLFTR